MDSIGTGLKKDVMDNCSSGVAISINNAGVAHASSLGGHTLEADVVGAYGSATGHLVLSLGIILAAGKYLKQDFVAAPIKFPNALETSIMTNKSKTFSQALSVLMVTADEHRNTHKRNVNKIDEASKKDLEDLFQDFYDEYFDSSKIMKFSTKNVETSINEEVFHEVSELFQRESYSSSLNDDVQQSPKEVILPSSNNQSIPINMVPNGDEASTSHNVFNERLEDAYFDASTSFHDSSNVHTFYQSYPHEKKWTKDHPLHKIIGDLKSSVRTRGQLANSCLLSSIEPANMAEALRDADWVSAMQEELDQFARLKFWRLVPRPDGKSVIKTKWIFKNKKDESSLVIRNKERLVAVGYSQQEGIDYDETFATV
nr:Gag-Pol polyprotein [Tanacetum cinerariifolium]